MISSIPLSSSLGHIFFCLFANDFLLVIKNFTIKVFLLRTLNSIEKLKVTWADRFHKKILMHFRSGYEGTTSVASTAKAKYIEKKVELNQNILCAHRLLIRAYRKYFWDGISYKEETSGASCVGCSFDQKAKCTCYYCYQYCCYYCYY